MAQRSGHKSDAQATGNHPGERNELPGSLRDLRRQPSRGANLGDLCVKTNALLDLHGDKWLILQTTESNTFAASQRVSRGYSQDNWLAV